MYHHLRPQGRVGILNPEFSDLLVSEIFFFIIFQFGTIFPRAIVCFAGSFSEHTKVEEPSANKDINLRFSLSEFEDLSSFDDTINVISAILRLPAKVYFAKMKTFRVKPKIKFFNFFFFFSNFG